MGLDQDVNDQEKGTIVDHGKRVGVINLGVEIAMMIITEREAESERDTGIAIGTVTGSATESENTVIVRRSSLCHAPDLQLWETSGPGEG